MTNNYDIFISYSRQNLQQVIAIRDELKEQVGVDSWIDLKGIESGEQFVNVIMGNQGVGSPDHSTFETYWYILWRNSETKK